MNLHVNNIKRFISHNDSWQCKLKRPVAKTEYCSNNLINKKTGIKIGK